MAPQKFRVIFTESAWTDLKSIVTYWTRRGEPERGEKYAYDLPVEAVKKLSDPETASSGRFLKNTAHPKIQELGVFKHSYRILYFVRNGADVAVVLRFWHSHRDEPFQDET